MIATLAATPAPVSDEALMDAYSTAVSGAVSAAYPAVVHIEVQGQTAPANATRMVDVLVPVALDQTAICSPTATWCTGRRS